MSATELPERKPAWLAINKQKLDLFLIGIFVFGLALRAAWLWKDRLWLDEVWSATFAVQPVIDVVISTLRFDPHPPLYYLQLHLWATISHSTVWLFANSLAWSSLSVVSLFFVVNRLFSKRLSTISTILFAAMPAAVMQAHSLRMYPMLTCLCIWAWYFTDRCLREPTRRRELALISVLFAVSYSHATGAFIFLYVGTYAVCCVFLDKIAWSHVIRWVRLYIVAGVMALPAVANSLVRSVSSHTTVPGLTDVLKTLVDLSVGDLGKFGNGFLVPVSLVVVTAVFVGMVKRELRPVLIGFLLVPFGFAVAVSYLLRPIWIDRIFLFTTPFLALSFANLFAVCGEGVSKIFGFSARRNLIAAITVAASILLAAASLWEYDANPKPTNFEAAAAFIRSEIQPGDVVYVPDNVRYWGIAWYAIGPDWGSPLSVQGNSSLDCNDRWCAILERLGPIWRRRLHLEPATRIVWHEGVPFIVGWATPDEAVRANRVWVVTAASAPHPSADELGAKLTKTWTDDEGLRVQLLTH